MAMAKNSRNNESDLIETTITFWAMAYVISVLSCNLLLVLYSLIECLFMRKRKTIFLLLGRDKIFRRVI